MVRDTASGAIYIPGYGCYGYPDYQNGWRYVRPFVENGNGESVYASEDYYNVRTEDLKKIAVYLANEDAGLKAAMEELKLSKKKMADWMVTSIDRSFYENGIFCSEELKRSLWDGVDTAILIMALLLTGISFAGGKKKQ